MLKVPGGVHIRTQAFKEFNLRLGEGCSFDESHHSGASVAVVGIHAKANCATRDSGTRGVDAQGALTTRTSDDIEGGFRRHRPTGGLAADRVVAGSLQLGQRGGLMATAT